MISDRNTISAFVWNQGV